jgi:ubiquinone/menaquinone biosynthesis C-methylase UbiE
MPDVYNTITTAEPSMIQRIAIALEVRAADRQQQRMLESYLHEIQFPPAAKVVEVGCGTGPVARRLATWPNVAEVIGLDPSSVFIAKARELGAPFTNLSFREGLAHPLPFSDAEVDVVVFHTTLCHLSEPREALREAFRVLRPGGWLAIYDGDYASTTFGTGTLDPLQICAESFRANFVHDSWLARRTPMLAQAAGFGLVSYRTHGYTESSSPDYMLTIVDRGADALASTGQIGPGLAEALKAEARRRVPGHEFFGHINYTSLVARKPG